MAIKCKTEILWPDIASNNCIHQKLSLEMLGHSLSRPFKKLNCLFDIHVGNNCYVLLIGPNQPKATIIFQFWGHQTQLTRGQTGIICVS